MRVLQLPARRPSAMAITTIGLDIAKNVFQVHGEDAGGRVIVQKRLSRAGMEAFFSKLAPCALALEACGTSHYLGHEVKLIPAAYVKPFVKRNKTDARDAAAICVAAGRPDMRAVAIKSEEQQASRGLERARELLVKQRTQLMNHVRALLAQAEALAPTIEAMERQIVSLARADAAMRRLMTIPGVGPLTAHAVVAAIGEGKQFGSARDFAAWAGLTPRESSSAGKRKTKGVSRQGESRLRKLFALGAATLMRNARARPERATAWRRGILARRPMKVAVLAQAAKTARIAWAILTSGAPYAAPANAA